MGNIKEQLADLLREDGAVGVALVDYKSGMALEFQGGNPDFDIEVAGASNANVVRTKLEVVKKLNLQTELEDILITLGNQYHLIRPLTKHPNLFLYYVLKRDKSNLAMARHMLIACDKKLEV